MDRRAVLGIAGGGGTAAVAVVALLILLLLGKCSLPLNFGKSGAVVPPKPSASAAAASTPTVDGGGTPTPLAAASPTPTPTPSPSPSPTPSTPAQLIISSLPLHVGEIGVDYAPVTLTAAGGKPPYRWATNAGALPAGLALSQDGVLSGKPTAAGGFTPTFHVDDSAGQAAGAAAPITIAPALTASGLCTQICNVEVGCTAGCLSVGVQTGGVGPYSYRFTGATPYGTSFANSLVLGGTADIPPAVAAPPPPSKFSITVSDSLGATSAPIPGTMAVYTHLSIRAFSFSVFGANGGSSRPMSYTPGLPAPVPSGTVSNGPPGSKVVIGANNTFTIVVPAGSTPANYSNAVVTLTDQAFCGSVSGQQCADSNTITITVT